ncbi:MAG: 3-hydroxyacyl-CoA dehydrogenase family protein [Ancalomicrobiaceae bacterium]|nr:3-hydroxyacyl-CoA dehydrogenase family protein [Ancalomicrobiaceae bacterium]
MSQKIGVIGGGTMGHGIAAAFALGGCPAILYEPAESQRAAILPAIRDAYALLVEEGIATAAAVVAAETRLHLTDDLSAAVADRDFIVEAIPERLDLKQALFADLDVRAPADAVLASNTSSLPLAAMMETVSAARRERMLVTHWYNPPLIMPLVELSLFGNMPEPVYDRVAKLHASIGKRTVKVLKDVPGLIANRIQQAIAREVFSIIEQGIAAPEDVDRALKFGPAFRYATTGQLEVADFGGLDIWAAVGDNLLAVMDASKAASPLLKQKVAEGKLGVKSGEGFYRYSPDTVGEVRRAFLKRLIHQLKASRAYG